MSKNSIFLLSYLAGLAIFTSACGSSSASNTFSFYYYPQKNVYFDPSRNKYFYSLDGAKSWDSMAARNENPAALGPRVILSSAIRDIWKNNPEHRKEFNGSLINISLADTLIVAEATPPQKKVVMEEPRTEPKKEKRSFFQRLFGKKKKTEGS